MRTLLFLVIISLGTTAHSESPFNNKIYTPEVVVDQQNAGPKGAVQLLWQKDLEATRYEVEVSNGRLIYSQVGERNFHHVMLFFGKDYQWRVREVSARQTTQFSPWMPVRVVRSQKVAQNQSQREPASVNSLKQVDEFVLDTGDQ